MIKHAVFAAGILFAVGCGKSKADEMLDLAAKFTDKMCECKDKDCVDAVQKEMSEAKKAFKGEVKKEDISGDAIAKAMELDKKMRECRDKIRDAK